MGKKFFLARIERGRERGENFPIKKGQRSLVILVSNTGTRIIVFNLSLPYCHLQKDSNSDK